MIWLKVDTCLRLRVVPLQTRSLLIMEKAESDYLRWKHTLLRVHEFLQMDPAYSKANLKPADF